MRWTSNVPWLLLAIACQPSNSDAVPRKRGSFMRSSAGGEGDELSMQAARSGLPTWTRETEQSLQRNRLVDNDAERTAVPYGSNIAGTADSGTPPYVRLNNPEDRAQWKGRHTRVKPDQRSLSFMGHAPDAQGVKSYSGDNNEAENELAVDASPTDELVAPSHLQLGVSQIVDQLLTGMLGTGLKVMQGGAAAGQQPAAAAAPMQPYGPTPAYYPPQETGLSTVEIILIISGSILILGLLGLLVWLAMSKKRRRR